MKTAKSLHKKQAGFSVVEGLLLVVLVLIIAGTGYYVYYAQQQTDKTLTAANNEKFATPAKSATVSSADNEYGSAVLTGYDKLPTDFKPVIIAKLKAIDVVCKTNKQEWNKLNPGMPAPTAGGQVVQVVRNTYISLNLQQEDCEGGALFYYVKFEGNWVQPFRTTGLDLTCTQINKYKFTKVIIPNCYDSDNTVPNINP